MQIAILGLSVEVLDHVIRNDCVRSQLPDAIRKRGVGQVIVEELDRLPALSRDLSRILHVMLRVVDADQACSMELVTLREELPESQEEVPATGCQVDDRDLV